MSCRKDAWLGFHPQFRGFGGEEGYIHEKFRRAGRSVWCLPFLRWLHRFGRPQGVTYPLMRENRVRNYLLGRLELGLPYDDVLACFAPLMTREQVEPILIELGLPCPPSPNPHHRPFSPPRGRLGRRFVKELLLKSPIAALAWLISPGGWR